MNPQPETQLDAFEAALLAELRQVMSVGDGASAASEPMVLRPRWLRRRWQLVGVAAAALAVVVVIPIARPTPAYAVTGRNDTWVTVKVNRLEGADGLMQALGERGVPADVTYLPPGKQCAAGRYTELRAPGMSLEVSADRFRVRIPPDAVGRGGFFVLSASVVPRVNGVSADVAFGISHGPVTPCRVVDAP